MALTKEETAILDSISRNHASQYVEDMFKTINLQKTKREILKAKGISNKRLDKDIKDLDAMIRHAKDNRSQFELLKKDSRVSRIDVDGNKMSIMTNNIPGRGKYAINMDFGGINPSYNIKGKHHPMLSNGHIHICSHRVRLNKYMRRGDFYRAALILLSFLHENASKYADVY
jgi:hypothetical protein